MQKTYTLAFYTKGVNVPSLKYPCRVLCTDADIDDPDLLYAVLEIDGHLQKQELPEEVSENYCTVESYNEVWNTLEDMYLTLKNDLSIDKQDLAIAIRNYKINLIVQS